MVKRTHTQPSQETQDEAMRIAKANQRPGQTKEQTKLVAQGIQKGIEQYKKQHKAKLRELDRQKKKLNQQREQLTSAAESAGAVSQEKAEQVTRPIAWLPWSLLALTWIGIAVWFSL